MASKKGLRAPSRVFLALAGVCLLGTLAVFFHSYYLESYFNVHVVNDPRWRIFNFNSRQAARGRNLQRRRDPRRAPGFARRPAAAQARVHAADRRSLLDRGRRRDRRR